MGTIFRSWQKNFVNIVYPLSCFICKVELDPLTDKPLCENCWNKIEYNPPPFCRRCGRHLPAKNQDYALLCQDCQKSVHFFQKARSVCIYEGITKECIHRFKYNQKLSLVKPFSTLMIEFARSFLDMKKIDLIVPVPLHSVKLRQRQFNQAKLLAQPIAYAYSKKLVDKILIKIKRQPDQVTLSQAKRFKNVRGAFKVKRPQYIKDKNILLVDDVLTTGATANECARVLQEAKTNKVDVLVLARTR
jgi:ComF family protein